MLGTINKESLLEKNKHIDKQELDKNLELVEKMQKLGIKKQYSLASPMEIKRVQTMDISKESLIIQLRASRFPKK